MESVAQLVAVTGLRRRQPALRRPDRQWLYPIPSVVAGHAPLEERVGGGSLSTQVSAMLGRQVTVAEAFEVAESDDLVSLNDLLRRAVPFPPDLVIARYCQDAPLVGAVAIALDAAGQATCLT